MAKNNAFLARVQAAKEEAVALNTLVMKQQASDAAMIALNECFGFGPERAARFHSAFVRTFEEIGRMINEDAKADKEITYARDVIDRRLKTICGEKFQPWEERYSW